MELLLAALVPILVAAFRNWIATQLVRLFTTAGDRLTPWLLRNWKAVCVVALSSFAALLAGWWTATPDPSPPRVEVETVVKYLDRWNTLEVERPHNCVEPEPATPEEVATAAGLVAYLEREHVAKYAACLASLAGAE